MYVHLCKSLFNTTHHLFLDTEATTLIVMDITKGVHQLIGRNFELGYLKSPAEVLHYRLDLFHTDADKYHRDPKIAIVLTHTDLIESNRRASYINNYKDGIIEMINDKPYAIYIQHDKIYAVSNATDSDSDFQELREQLLEHLAKQDTWGYDMPVCWLKLKADIINNSNRNMEMYLRLEEVWKLGHELRMSTADVESFLQKQMTLGDFVYFSDPELRDLVITEPKWLVEKCKALITAREFIDQRTELPGSICESLKKGEITEDGLKELLNNDGIVFLIRLMKKFDLLVDVSDQLGHKYIIPCMLGSKFHKEKPHKALIGSFPQFVSKCLKEMNWEISQDKLSYTTTSFNIGRNVKLSLSLLLPVQVQTKFDWPKEISSCDRDKIQRETKTALAKILKTCRIQTSDDEESNKSKSHFIFSFFRLC